ncbi:hypothetical protein COHA_000325 [Chlorella ohadii]|uniref:Uncharacterized protein n=1 Tax=Chlorella ohadii TaxID=2649997 RepID=A0AAD5H9L7_9CHLO|nr:hypothetical protein COHA_000325 [Chlorella ohadii]
MNKTYAKMLEYQALLDSKAPEGRAAIMGNILWSPWQTFFYGAQAANPCIRTICEIGFGAGHSTVLFTSVNPHVHIFSFDMFTLGTYQVGLLSLY